MLDPLTAVGLGASFIQFVDFSSKLIVKGYEIYTSTNGTLRENIEIEAIIANLQTLLDQILLDPSNNAADQTEEGRAVTKLTKECSEVAHTLLDILNDLKVKTPGKFRSWESLRQSVRTARRAEKIKKLQKKLQQLTVLLNSHLLFLLQKKNSLAMRELQTLKQASEQMQLNNLNGLKTLEDSTLDALRNQERQILKFETATTKNQEELAGALAAGFKTVQDQLQSVRSEGQVVLNAQKVLKSLIFPEMAFRYQEVRDAYTNTFTWIFEDDKTPFLEWLRTGSGVFWIGGKAGSGKSTLMKYLCEHDSTKATLQEWASGERLVMANFFFWCSGLEKQKSQEGLLQSLLYQILLRCPELIPTTCPKRWAAKNILEIATNPWTRGELSQALDNTLSSDNISSKFCFFIDGLDEYAGDQYSLVKDFANFAKSDQIKLCVSSRPWNAFVKAYGDVPYRKLILQDLTRPDMEIYVEGMLNKDDRFRELANRNPQAQHLVESVRERAEGVFLWVFLVIRSLLSGLTEDDDIPMLQRRLEKLPTDLETFLKLILSSVDKVYQDHTARAIQLATIGIPLYLPIFWHLPRDMTDESYASCLEVRNISAAEFERSNREATSNINKWCRDLIEVHRQGFSGNDHPNPGAEGSTQLTFVVTFLHRTVRDFFMSQEMQEFLKNSVSCRPSPDFALCRLHLAVAKGVGTSVVSGEEFKTFVRVSEKVMQYAKYCEMYDNVTPTQLLRELDRIGDIYWLNLHRSNQKPSRKSDRVYWPTEAVHKNGLPSYCPRGDFLAYAVVYDLTIFVQSSLEENSSSISSKALDPLLSHAMPQRLWSQIEARRIRGEVSTTSSLPIPSYEMVKLLIEHGANPNDKVRAKITVWQAWLSYCHGMEDQRLWPITELMAKNGADLGVTIVVRERANHLWAAQTVYATVPECLQRHCPLQDVNAFLEGCTQQRPSGWLSWVPRWKI